MLINFWSLEKKCVMDRKKRDDVNYTKLKDLARDLDTTDLRLILCAKRTGAWLNV